MKQSGSWIDLPVAERRLAEIDRELERVTSEKALIELVLGKAGVATVMAANPSDSEHQVATLRAFPMPKRHVPLADLVVEALRLAPPEGRTVGEILRHIVAHHPERASDLRLSATVSSAIAKARATKNPRIQIVKRGHKGEASRYAAIR